VLPHICSNGSERRAAASDNSSTPSLVPTGTTTQLTEQPATTARRSSSHCPKCGEALACQTTFTSIESIDLNGSVSVKASSSIQPFQRDKLFLSVHDSLKHRETSLSDATSLTDTIISGLAPQMKNALLQKDDIINVTFGTLQRFDTVAATYYRAFHPTNLKTED